MPHSKPASNRTQGRCLCGAIRYEFEGKPKWVGHCHCASCRKHTSSAVATFVGVPITQFDYLEGTPAAYESSPAIWRYFCSACGTPMAYTDDKRWPGEVHLYIGTLEHPEKFPATVHVNIQEQLPWFEVHDDLPRYENFGGKGAPPVRKGPKRM